MRYFIEVSYKGTGYAGFQIQKNANTIQGKVEEALSTYLRHRINLTGSSRTDAGVHAYQNFFHFDFEDDIIDTAVYNLNAMLPKDIVVRSLRRVADNAHCRFLATSRVYDYCIATRKDPFSADTAWFYPYPLDIDCLNKAAVLLYNYQDYSSFSKRNTQTFTNICTIIRSEWKFSNFSITYTVEANRFLRGMVRSLVGTMLLAGRKKISLAEFEEIIVAKDCTKANFATPAHGLFLMQVVFP